MPRRLKAASEHSALNPVPPRTAAGKLTAPWLARRVLRGWILAPLLVVCSFAFAAGRGSRARLRFGGVGLLMTLGCLVFSASPASALNTHTFAKAFAAPGSAAGQLALSGTSGLAVNASTHDVYVADTNNHRVDEFEVNGTFIRAWGWEVNGIPGFGECTLISGCQVGASGSGPGEFEAPSFIAVDNSGGASEGDVYVGDTADSTVAKFTEDGVLVSAWGDGGAGESANGQLTGSHVAGEGTATAGSATLESVTTTTGAFSVGQEVTGAGIPAGTTIISVGAGTLELSQAAEASGTVALSAHQAFGSLEGVTVDSAGALDVLTVANPKLMFQFDQAGGFTSDFEPGRENETKPAGLAVDAAGEFFKANGDDSVNEFTPAGEIGQVTSSAGAGIGSAVGLAAAGSELYVAQTGTVLHYAFKEPGVEPGVVLEPGGTPCQIAPSAPCPPFDSFGSSEATGGSLADVAGIAADASNQDVFVADAATGLISVFTPAVLPDVEALPATAVHPFSATLNGTVNPEGLEVSECAFEYGETTSYGKTAACEQGLGEGPGEIGKGTSPVPVSANLTGLTAGITYHFRLRAQNQSHVSVFSSPDASFPTPPPPAITSPAVSHLTSETAQLEADVNPGGLPLKSCVFEYGKTTGYGTVIECTPRFAQVGEGTAPVAVTAVLSKLEHDHTYHWRVVVSSEAGTTTTPDHVFIDPETAGGLPDGRSYEMVTPPSKNAALVNDIIAGFPSQVADSGERVILGTVQCFAGAGSCIPTSGVANTGAPMLFRRSADGWTATPLAPSAARYETPVTWAFANAEAETSLWEIPTPPHSTDDLYGRSPEGAFTDIGPLGDVQTTGENLALVQSVTFLAASADLSHVVYQVNEHNPWPFNTKEEGPGPSVFQYVGARNTQPELLGVSGGLGSRDQISACEDELGSNKAPGVAGDESADGRMVYFTTSSSVGTGACGGGTEANKGIPVATAEVFARVDGGEAGAETVAVSEPQAPELAHEPHGDEPQENCSTTACVEDTSASNQGAWRPAVFYGTSTDGSKAYFRSEQQLTDGAAQGSPNLYLYDAGVPHHHWFDASEAEAGKPVPGGPRVLAVLAYSSDGSHAYFVANGVLTGANTEGRSPVDGAENVYAYQRDSGFPDGHLAYVAQLNAADANEQFSSAPGNPANVTPDGRFLVFTSHAALTGDATRTDGAIQVYRYDAQTGVLARVSIGQDGYNDNGNAATGDAEIAPGFKGYERLGAARPNPTMSNDGSRVFFMSPIGLTAKALNDVAIGTNSHGNEHFIEYAQNIYEWEAEGVGSCGAGHAQGCVYLISDAHDTSSSPEEACKPDNSATCLIGTDESGKNVFFQTADPLSREDTDTQSDVYDARICEPENGNPCITPPAEPLPPCSGESCHGIPPATPAPPATPSTTFNGAGNTHPAPPKKVTTKAVKCHKGFVKNKKNKCVKKSKKKKTKAKKSAKGRA